MTDDVIDVFQKKAAQPSSNDQDKTYQQSLDVLVKFDPAGFSPDNNVILGGRDE